MNMKKVLSSVLCAIMIFTLVAAAVPVKVDAAYSPSTSTGAAALTPDEVKNLFSQEDKADEGGIKGIYTYNFNNAKEMLDFEYSAGYLNKLSLGGDYELYVNKYTGYVYYVNKLTGQILTSNPYTIPVVKPGDDLASNNESYAMTSQIIITLEENAGDNGYIYHSSDWAGDKSQISVSYIKNGIRVNYTLGDTSSRLLPVAMEASKFEELILKPILEYYQALLLEFNPDLAPEEYDFFAADSWFDVDLFEDASPVYESSGFVNTGALKGYMEATSYIRTDAKIAGFYGYENMQEIADTLNGFFGQSTYNLYDAAYWIDIYNNADEFEKGSAESVLNNMFRNFPITGKWDGETPVAGTPIYAISSRIDYTESLIEYEKYDPLDAKKYSEFILKYCAYSLSDIVADESELDLTGGLPNKPVFRCSLEYTINDNGTLDIALPASSISFDESLYTLVDIIPLKYFGCGVIYPEYESYALFPDGSGMITDFSEFEKDISYVRQLYGTDYAFSSLNTLFEYQEQVTMPVYGVVTDTASNSDPSKLVKNGYFAIIKEGSALADLNMFSSSSTKCANPYLSLVPYPSDEFDISETISVGESTVYTLTLESKFTGSFVINITMLTDPDIKSTLGLAKAYVSDYSGMAARYRDYLTGNKMLSELQNIQEGNIPLYIETLGAMEVVKKYLTFPVNVNIPLTTFDNIITMYNELSDAKKTLLDMAAEYQQLADDTPKDNPSQKEFYENKAKEYTDLSAKVQNITNVNFKLTGFANDGMDYVYPSKVKWEKACGGSGGFKALAEKAKTVSASPDANLGIYPDFDFMYLKNDSLFSGVKRWDKARMIDNRYASMQIYNPAKHEYEPGFGSLISTGSLNKLFTSFEKHYAKLDWKYISLSTFGSTLNSNLDKDDSINRDMSLDYVTEVLSSIKEKGYSLMVEKGNAYTYAYADHIINMSIDSSHHTYCSYTVPFMGMVLHGYVNYSGNAINYSGSTEYDILRSIENGASPYYILCYQNIAQMKDSPVVNKYYAVSYATWFERIADTYSVLNSAIGDLQDYKIAEHKAIIGEKYVSDEAKDANAKKIQDEFVELLKIQLHKLVNAKLDELPVGTPASIKLTVDVDALCQQLANVTSLPASYIDNAFKDRIASVIAEVTSYFGIIEADGANEIVVSSVSGEGVADYESDYDYFTNGIATDSNYDTTFYSVTNRNIVMVTYVKYDSNGNAVDTVKFILNYNIDKVSVRLSADEEPIILGKYDFVRVD